MSLTWTRLNTYKLHFPKRLTVTDIVSDETLSKALKYLAETDQDCARAKGLYDGLEDQTKTVSGILYLQMPTGTTVAEKEARVCASETYIDHKKKVNDSFIEYETMRNKRSTAVIITDVWRTAQANKRAGNI